MYLISRDWIFMFLYIFSESMQLQLDKLSRLFIFVRTDVQNFLG